MDPIIDIILDGKIFAMRNWKIIPRIGEVIILKDGETWAKVKQVVWSDDTAAPPGKQRQWVQLVCETTERP